jgi:hypothetical protein
VHHPEQNILLLMIRWPAEHLDAGAPTPYHFFCRCRVSHPRVTSHTNRQQFEVFFLSTNWKTNEEQLMLDFTAILGV